MRVPIEWLRSLVDIPTDVSTVQLAARLTAFDLKLEEIISSGVEGPLVVGRIISLEPEPQKNGKTINWCRVDVGTQHNDDDGGRGIVCGAHNFGVGDHVVVSLPGATLPGGFQISARKTYGHVSDGMICSSAELGLPGDASGIIILDPAGLAPGDDALALLGLDTEVLDLEVNPDRAYALSLRGVARDTAVAFGLAFSDPAGLDVQSNGTDYPVVVDDPSGSPFLVTRSIHGFDPTRPTPDWMSARITAAGMRPISLAVDVTNYVMLELGQPLHGYDLAQLQGPIRVRRAIDGEKLTTLDGVVRSLDVEDLLITDDRGPVGLAGVMGGADVELSGTTTDIVIEAAYFDPVSIARTSRRHKISSEAARRFERGVDPELPLYAAQRAAQLLVEHGGGSIRPGLTAVGVPPQRVAVSIEADLPARVSGVPISETTAVEALEANGCHVALDSNVITATPPSWRFDLQDPYDLVEEVLRVVGYDQVPSVLPRASGGRGLTRHQVLRRRLGYVLAGAGYVEIKTFPFAGPVDFDKLGFAEQDSRRRQVLLANPLSQEEPGLTTTLLAGVLRALALNVGRGHEDIAISEFGRVFKPLETAMKAPIYGVDRRPTPEQLADLDAAIPDQPWHVAFAVAGHRERDTWDGPGRLATWADAISSVLRIADVLHVHVDIEQAEYAPFHPGRCAAVLVDGEVVGHAGELHPKVVERYGLPARSVAGEVDFDALLAAAPLLGPRPDFSSYPVAKEDYAFILDAGVPAERLRAAILNASELIESARIFDVYSGDQVADGQKSIAISVRLRAADRTLAEAEIRAARSAVVDAAARLGATLR